ncbi:MAG TPA: YciI family protein [Thermomicrobiales bacterium]|nr:YciI family protein [Thermomicrobiales bacterium]
MARFMLLLRGGAESMDEYSPEDFQRIIQPYIDWSNALRAEGRHLGGDELDSGGRVVRLRNGQATVDGPYTETKENIGGYFIIQAADEDEAAEIAKGCPILRHGGLVEVRAIVEH